MTTGAQDPQKLYQQIARAIATAINDGRYGPGDKLPSERELADDFGVSRPTIRDAMIALEFQGLVEARQGSGVYVNATAIPAGDDPGELEVGALELTEARRLFEGEACALSAATITDENLTLLDQTVAQMVRSFAPDEVERLEQEFHLAIARATGNAAIEAGVEDLWTLRQQSPTCVAMLRRARTHTGGDFVEEHRKIVSALRRRDPKAARQAIHGHLAQVIDDLLAVTELDALQQTRQKMAEQRRELARRTEI
ncbi:FadR/GntR family transcriptional regulator [Caulobacter soli]|uniref:FadR/GntR family transcriptional regulator n=1 Tax=Caulobacter soli TaxID=2708539 RepID=UPI0013ED52B5|nr:FadR/GntR family transcriptional regulator [Caulobacter soli]